MPGGGLAIVMDDADGPDDVGQDTNKTDTCCADETSTTTRRRHFLFLFPHLRKSRRRRPFCDDFYVQEDKTGRTASP